MGQTRSLPLAQAFKVPIRHRALHLSGNSAAVESFAGSDHGGKYAVAGILTFFCQLTVQEKNVRERLKRGGA
jgi:hypothetical protein